MKQDPRRRVLRSIFSFHERQTAAHRGLPFHFAFNHVRSRLGSSKRSESCYVLLSFPCLAFLPSWQPDKRAHGIIRVRSMRWLRAQPPGIGTVNSFAGFQAGAGWRPSSRITLVADFTRLFATDSHATFNTFMVGPRLWSRDHDGLAGFVQLRAGAERADIAGQVSQGVAWGPGAGADIRFPGGIVWRVIEVDLNLGRGAGASSPGLRYSSGFAFRLGH
jgi:hypothetical protein